ncbi:MAG: NUDIX domain-containing protein [Betaproteobacteria bacterium]|nr:NUDIX domain-containing protein [Betaproteobacteria bacterium]
MKLNHDIVTTPPRPAATVMLLRDGPRGPEVFMVRRHGLSDVLGGAYVFPGGKVDQDDAAPALLARADRPAPALHAALGEPELAPETAASMFIAALRETFEEAGLLLAGGPRPPDPARAGDLAREGLGFAELLERLDTHLAVGRLVPFTRWITPIIPSVQSKRFDTRFFAVKVSGDAVARHDDRETTESEWLAPRAALERYWAREISLAPPQIMSLAQLARHADVDSVLREAGSRPPPVIQPEPLKMDGLRVVAYPGDPAHPVSARAMPGPSRLVFREDRFEPVDGFGALFA